MPMPENSCFFTGHRYAPNDAKLIAKTNDVIVDLIENKGITEFYAGGAVGWDMICENIILDLKEKYLQIKLHLVLPCQPEIQTSKWNNEQKEEYHKILKFADDVEFVSKKYSKDCMKKRNTRLVEQGGICVCYFNENDSRSGTAQTVRMARESGKEIINMHDFYGK